VARLHVKDVRRRLLWLGAAGLAIGCGLALRLLTTGPLADHGGVIIYALMMYGFAGVITPRRPHLQAALGLTGCFAVEALQLTGIPATLGRKHMLWRLALGSTFSISDLLAYTAGIMLAMAGRKLATCGQARPHPNQPTCGPG
jgi:hypothetical protein